MNRRDAIRALLALGAAPLTARAQQPAKPARIVIFSPFHRTPASEENILRPFRSGLEDEALKEGRDYTIDLIAVPVDGQLANSVREALRRDATLLVPLTTPVAQAVAREARGLPVLFGIVSDPIGSGLVASLARPGGDVSGVSNMLPEISGKLLELLLELVSGTSQVAVLFNPDNSAKMLELRELRATAKTRGVALRELPVRSGPTIESALNNAKKDDAEALIILDEALTNNYAQRIGELTVRMRRIVVSNFRIHTDAGGLLSYSPDYTALNRRLGALAAKVLRGAKPRDLPVELPTKFQLVINLKTAKALGVRIPQSIRVRADEVIE